MSALPNPCDIVLDVDFEREIPRIAARMRETLVRYHRRGLVLGLSGGVDSSVCAALAVAAIGRGKVMGLLMPERESSPSSESLARAVAEHLGIAWERVDITGILEGSGCYRVRDEAIRRVLPQYGADWKNRIGIAGALRGQFNHFELVAQSPDGRTHRARLAHREYLQIVAATNFKQRARKMVEYFHADRLNYLVVGTPNRLEFDQGFFVKNGDGAADVKPIAHLYKTQVYALARHFGLPDEVCNSIPSTDTYTLEEGQDAFYFALPYHQLDIVLWGYNHGWSADRTAPLVGLAPEDVEQAYRDIATKRNTTRYLHAPPVLVEEVAGVGKAGDSTSAVWQVGGEQE